jgi:CubicO group peptidase (beta-lactamase class C family)
MLAAAAAAAGSATLRPVVSRAQDATPEADDTIHGAALEAALEKLDALAAQQIAEGAVPGMAIAVVQNDAVVFSKGYGVRDVDTGEPVDAHRVPTRLALQARLVHDRRLHRRGRRRELG